MKSIHAHYRWSDAAGEDSRMTSTFVVRLSFGQESIMVRGREDTGTSDPLRVPGCPSASSRLSFGPLLEADREFAEDRPEVRREGRDDKRPDGMEHIALVQLDAPKRRGEMQGAEATWRCLARRTLFGAARSHNLSELTFEVVFRFVGPLGRNIVFSLLEFGPIWAKSGPDAIMFGPDSTNLGPDSTTICPDAAKFGPDSTTSGLLSAKFGPDSLNAGLFRPISIRFAPFGCRLRPTLGDHFG